MGMVVVSEFLHGGREASEATLEQMLTEAERVYTTGELAERLGVSANMARRYGLAWEKLTGQEIAQQPGRGRMYPAATLEALEAARGWLIQHPAESVETALKITLGLEAEHEVDHPKHVPGQLSREDIREAVREGLAEVLAPIMAQLEAVRAENAEMKAKLEALPPPSEGSEISTEALKAQLEALERKNQETESRLKYYRDKHKGADPGKAEKKSWFKAIWSR